MNCPPTSFTGLNKLCDLLRVLIAVLHLGIKRFVGLLQSIGNTPLKVASRSAVFECKHLADPSNEPHMDPDVVERQNNGCKVPDKRRHVLERVLCCSVRKVLDAIEHEGHTTHDQGSV